MHPGSRTKLCLALLLGGLGVGGCVHYRPMSLDGRAELDALAGLTPQAVVSHADSAAPATRPATTRPFDPSDGLDEPEVVAIALTLNPELRAKRLTIGESQAQLITAGLWPNPEVGFAWRGGIAGASGSAIETDALWELLRPGQRNARKAEASAAVDQARAEIAAEEQRLVAEARLAYVEALGAERIIRLMEQELSLRKQAADLVSRRRAAGESSALDVTLAELELAESTREVRKARANADASRRALNRVLGLPPALPLTLSESARPVSVRLEQDPTDQVIDERILSHRQDLRAFEAAYRKTEQALRQAIAAQYPRLQLGPSYERDLDGAQSLGLGMQLELPLFDRNQGGIAEKEAQRATARASYIALLHRLRAEAHEARAVLRAARAEVEAAEKELLPLAERSRALVESAYRARQLSIVEWNTALERTLKAQRGHLEAVLDYRKSQIRLEAALGNERMP